jgi:hypothetical protein
MKKLFFISMLACGQWANAQYSLQFCEDVNKEGKPQMLSNSFMVDGDGGVLKFLARADDKFNTDALDFRIYFVNDAGKEEEILRMPQKVETAWNFAWKEVVFFDPGNYKIKLYTGKGTYLTSANLNIKKK